LKDTPAEEILNTIRRVHRGEAAIFSERGQQPAQKGSAAEFKSVEMEILKLIVQGHDNRTIGSQLGLGANALKYILRGLFSKLGVRKRAAAARVVIERGLLDIN